MFLVLNVIACSGACGSDPRIGFGVTAGQVDAAVHRDDRPRANTWWRQRHVHRVCRWIGSQSHLLGLEYEQVSRSERRSFQTVLIHGPVSISSGGLTSERRSASSL